MSYSSEVLADSPLAYYRLGDLGSISAVTASSSFSSEPPANAVDGNPTTYWTTNGVVAGWIRLQLASATVETKYSIRRRDDFPTRNPKDWTFEGSNDGSTWTVLDTQAGTTWPTAGETKTFTFANSTAYLYYRLNITAQVGTGSDPYTSVAELILSTVTAADASGNDRPGAYSGTVTRGTTGLLTGDSNAAATFDGSTGAMTVPNAAWQGQSAFTVEAWIKPSSVTGTRTIASRQGTSSAAVWTFRLEGTTLKFYNWDSGGILQGAISAPTVFAVGTTYHVAAVFTASGTRAIYVNGAQAVSGGASTLASTSESLRVGSSGNSGEYYAGVIDEVAFYGTALSSTRISAHYTAGTTIPPVGVNAVPFAATASVPAPTVSADASVTAPAMAASAAFGTPVVTGTGDATIAVPAFAASAAVAAPTLSADANPTSVAATATAALLAPSVAATTSATVTALPFAATADLYAPNVDNGSGSQTVFAAAMAATATFVPPVWTNVMQFATDTSNRLDGLDLVCVGRATVTTPVGAAPTGLAERHDVAIPYPVPVMVDGRPT